MNVLNPGSREISFAFLLLFILLNGLPQVVNAQCNDPGCLTDQLRISTGFDHSAGMVYPPSSPTSVVQDPHWILVNAPTNNGPVNLGSPAFVISTYPAWHDMPPGSPLPSRYISAFARAGANEANISGTPYVFERKICICDTTQVTFQENVHVDNQAVLRLKGPNLNPAGVLLSAYTTTTVDNFRNPPEDDGPVSLTLNPGTYYLQAEMRNDNSGSPMGLNIECTLIADKVAIADETCCNNGAFVSGFKFLDANCNGTQESTEMLDAGWTINLRNAGGIVATTTTDVSGYYFFNITTPGTYTIEEVTSAPWTQTFPVGGTHTVVITGTEVISNLNFGNCCPDCLAFQNSAGSLSFSCTSDGLSVTITPSGGLQPGDTYSVDLNNDNNFEITNVPAGQSVTYPFPHSGTFNLTFKATRIACGKPCEIETSKSILVEEVDCVDAECYDWNDVNDQLNVYDLCYFNGNIIAGGDQSGNALIASWDGTSWQDLSSINGMEVYEVEPYSGDLYALAINRSTQQVFYRWTGSLWYPVAAQASPTNLVGPAGAYAFLSEMERTSNGLYVALYENLGASVSHKLYHFDGTSLTQLPDPPGSILHYYQVGQYNDEPLVRVDLQAGGTFLATWNGSSWTQLTSPFFTSTFNPYTFNASGITSVTQMGNDLLAVGSFDGIGFGPTVAGTAGIARLNIGGGFWQSVGGGETSNNGTSIFPIHITRAHVFGDNIIVNGFYIDRMGGADTDNIAWFDGSNWHGLNNPPQGIYNAAVATSGTDDLCQVYMGGEPHFGLVELCCSYEDMNLSITETDRKLYYTNGSITSTSTISSTAEVTYKAGNGITLNPGFNVQPGALFSAVAEGCEDCCPPNPLTDLPWLAPYVNDPNYAISQCMYNGDCIYQIQDFCVVSDGTTAYYDCYGNLICEYFQVGGTCSPSFNPTNCTVLQSCSPSPIAIPTPTVASLQPELQVFPNPLTAGSRILLRLPEEGLINLQLMDLNGNVVRNILNGYQSAGEMTGELSASELSSGIYILVLTTSDSRISKKVVVTR
jgi:hypothetical protein